MKEIIRDMVKQERIAWVSGFAGLVIGVYYFSNAPLVMEIADLQSRGVRKVVMTCFGLMLLAEIVTGLVSKSRSGVTDEDERDERISDRSMRFAYRTLFVLLTVLIGHIVFFQTVASVVDLEAEHGVKALGELGIANVMLGILILASVARQGAKIFYYRRGY